MKRRIFSTLLALCMLLTLLPAPAFAEGDITISNQEDWDNLRNNGTPAIPETGGRIILKVDVEGDLTLRQATELTIDGTKEGGVYCITGTICAEKPIDLTLKNVKIAAAESTALDLAYGGSLITEESVSILGGATGSTYGVLSGSHLTVTASDNTTFDGGSAQYGGVGIRVIGFSGGNLTLNGGLDRKLLFYI